MIRAGLISAYFHHDIRRREHYLCRRSHFVLGGYEVRQEGKPYCPLHGLRLRRHCKPKPVAPLVPEQPVRVATYTGPTCGSCAHFKPRGMGTAGWCLAASPIAYSSNGTPVVRRGTAARDCPLYSPLKVILL